MNGWVLITRIAPRANPWSGVLRLTVCIWSFVDHPCALYGVAGMLSMWVAIGGVVGW